MTSSSTNRSEGAGGRTAERARSLSDQASATVRQAADVLEQELAAGLDEARRLQKKLTDQRRIEPGDLDEVSARVRGNAHLLIDMVSERFADLGTDEVQELGQRFAKDARGAFDALLDLVEAAPDVVNKLVEKAGVGKAPTGDSPAPATSPTPEPPADDATSAPKPQAARSAKAAKPAKAATAAKPARATKASKAAKAPGAARAPRRSGS